MRLTVAHVVSDADSFIRLPGAFRIEEVAQLVPNDSDIVLTPAGRTQGGEKLFAIHVPKGRTSGRDS